MPLLGWSSNDYCHSFVFSMVLHRLSGCYVILRGARSRYLHFDAVALDFTYFKVKGFGWYYLSTVLDDYSRYIIHGELCSSMSAQDVARSIDQAMLKAGLNHKNAPKLLSDNGPCYIASSLKEHLSTKFSMKHIHGKPLHPQTQGKIERYH